MRPIARAASRLRSLKRNVVVVGIDRRRVDLRHRLGGRALAALDCDALRPRLARDPGEGDRLDHDAGTVLPWYKVEPWRMMICLPGQPV
jgi:hypothetical protein